MALKLITAPTLKPVTVSDLSSQMRADLTGETALIELYISAVTAKAENYTKRALVTQTWELTLDCFPCSSSLSGNIQRIGAISLPLSPVQSITSIKYLDASGVLQTLASTEYSLTSDDPNVVVPAYGKTWPDTLMQAGAVVIKYVAGYGATAASIPEAIRIWIMLNVATLYENRETVVIGKGSLVELNTMADSLIDDYVLRSFR